MVLQQTNGKEAPPMDAKDTMLQMDSKAKRMKLSSENSTQNFGNLTSANVFYKTGNLGTKTEVSDVSNCLSMPDYGYLDIEEDVFHDSGMEIDAQDKIGSPINFNWQHGYDFKSAMEQRIKNRRYKNFFDDGSLGFLKKPMDSRDQMNTGETSDCSRPPNHQNPNYMESSAGRGKTQIYQLRIRHKNGASNKLKTKGSDSEVVQNEEEGQQIEMEFEENIQLEEMGHKMNIQLQPAVQIMNSHPTEDVNAAIWQETEMKFISYLAFPKKLLKRAGNFRRKRGKKGSKEAKKEEKNTMMDVAEENEAQKIERLRQEARVKRSQEPSVNVAIHLETELDFIQYMNS